MKRQAYGYRDEKFFELKILSLHDKTYAFVGWTLNKRDLYAWAGPFYYAQILTKIDYSPAWELNEKVIDFFFFSNADIDKREDSGKSFERMSKYNLIRGEAFVSGECVSVIEDSGFTNVEQVITRLLSSFSDNISRPSKVQIKISNLDKKQTQLYQRILQ